MKKLLPLLAIVFWFQSCQKNDFQISNLSDNTITTLGHAGMGIGSNYPMNSIESIIKCIEIGMDGSEIDIQLSKDTVLIAYHHPELTNHTDLEGIVNEFTLEEIKNTAYRDLPFLDYKIATLEEIIEATKNYTNLTLSLDCKLISNQNPEEYISQFTQAIVNILEQNEDINFIVESQDLNFLNYIRNQLPDANTVFYPSEFESGIEIAIENNLYGISISNTKINREQVAFAHQNGIKVILWNVQTTSQNTDAIEKNPDYIQTDNVRSLARLLSND